MEDLLLFMIFIFILLSLIALKDLCIIPKEIRLIDEKGLNKNIWVSFHLIRFKLANKIKYKYLHII